MTSRYVGHYEILEKFYPMTYRLDLPVKLNYVHSVFLISQFRRYVLDPNHAFINEPVDVRT